MKINMTNIAYTYEYIEHRKNIEFHLFDKACYRSEERRRITDKYSLVTKSYFYDALNLKYPYNLSGSENELISESREIVYAFRSIDDSGGFCTAFTHRNGGDYLVFRRDLYGYSVLDLATMRDFHYFPAESFPSGETFICDINYNCENNILAIFGCYWACPYSVFLADFTDPMKEVTQIDINEYINKDFSKYDDIDFVAWEGTDLVLQLSGNSEPVKVENKIITEKEYISWINNESKL